LGKAESGRLDFEGSRRRFVTQISEGSDFSWVSTAPSLEELSSPEFFTRQCSEIDAMAASVVGDSDIKDAICAAVEDVQFCVTIADPRAPDIPLIAASEQFLSITGYSRPEVLGKNCRFLNSGCSLDPVDMMRLRAANATGEAFTAVLTNRRKSGELFLNFLDLRGLTVAHNPYTGEELWFLVGIQADVTDISAADLRVDEGHLSQMHEVANVIRAKLADGLSAMAVAGALKAESVTVEMAEAAEEGWCLLPAPTWTCGGPPALSAGMAMPGPTLQCDASSRTGGADTEAEPEPETSTGRTRAKTQWHSKPSDTSEIARLSSALWAPGLISEGMVLPKPEIRHEAPNQTGCLDAQSKPQASISRTGPEAQSCFKPTDTSKIVRLSQDLWTLGLIFAGGVCFFKLSCGGLHGVQLSA